MTQVNKPFYSSEKYLNQVRFLGLREQLILCIQSKGKTFLEVGPGAGLLTALLKNMEFDVTTLDVNKLLLPDIVADVLNIPCRNDMYDVVCAFEILEHLPFQSLTPALAEMSRVSKGRVIISVPDHAGLKRSNFGFMMCLFGRTIQYYSEPRPKYKDITNSEEHRWEIGIRGIEVRNVLESIKNAGMQCLKHYLPCAYFHFFVCNRL